MNILNFIWSSPLANPQEEVIKYFQEQEELKCDPLYLAVTLGNVYLLYQRLLQQHQEEAEKLVKENKTVRPLQGIKISFKEDSNIKITEPGLTQSLSRRLWGEGRVELGLIRPHLIKLFRWFDYQDPYYQTIFKACQCGIEAILKGYKYQQVQKITISQTNSKKPHSAELKEEKEIVQSHHVIEIQPQTSETDFVIRILENDIALLNEAIKEKDERQQQEFIQKLNEEDAKYFPLHQLKLIKVAKTIDAYMMEQVKTRWDSETLGGIVKLFKAEASKAFNRYDSIALLISRNPAAHQTLKAKVRDLLAATLPNCNLSVQDYQEAIASNS